MPELNNISSILGPIEFSNSGHTPTAYYRFESGAETTDSSGNSHTLSAISDPAGGTGKFGGGVDLDGNDAYSATDHADFKPTGAFTVGLWVKRNGNPGSTETVFQSYNQDTGTGYIGGWRVAITSGGSLYYQTGKNIAGGDGTGWEDALSSVTVTNNEWKFAVITWDTSTIRMYINGVLDQSVSWSNAPVYQATNFVRIGSFKTDGSESFFTGSLDDVFLINGTALTSAQISTIYGVQAYYRFNTGALTTDSKGSYTLTNNNTVGEAASGKFGYSTDFGSTNTNKSLSKDSTYGITSWGASFSVSLWIKRYSELGSGEQPFFAKEIKATTGGINYISYEYNGGTRRLKFARYDETTSEAAYININLGTDWNHVVYVYNGTNIIPYANGVAGTPVASDGTSLGTSYQNDLHIGTDGGGNYWSGYIDDVSVFNRVLTAAEVLSIYKSGAGALFFAQY